MTKIPDKFRNKSISNISHHGQGCCRRALAWVQAMHQSHSVGNEDDLPWWLRDQFDWGASTWPIYWCELIERDEVDCGVFAAVTRVLLATDERTVVPIQLVYRYNSSSIENWQSSWQSVTDPDWVKGQLAYHEVVGTLDGEHLYIWDPVEATEPAPPTSGGYGEVIGVRVPTRFEQQTKEAKLKNKSISIGEWTTLVDDLPEL